MVDLFCMSPIVEVIKLNWVKRMLSGHEPRYNNNQVQLYASVNAPYNNANANSSVRVHGVKFSNTGSGNIIIDGGITLFKYGES